MALEHERQLRLSGCIRRSRQPARGVFHAELPGWKHGNSPVITPLTLHGTAEAVGARLGPPRICHPGSRRAGSNQSSTGPAPRPAMTTSAAQATVTVAADWASTGSGESTRSKYAGVSTRR